jgi:hypothetical protein
MDEAQTIPYGYCQCGCGERTTLYTETRRGRGGMVKGQPARFLLGHHSRRSGYTPPGYRTDGPNGCWVWTGYTDPNGYGRLHLSRPRRTVQAHRYVYEQLVGPIPEGLEMDHLCRNPSCVNPQHREVSL